MGRSLDLWRRSALMPEPPKTSSSQQTGMKSESSSNVDDLLALGSPSLNKDDIQQDDHPRPDSVEAGNSKDSTDDDELLVHITNLLKTTAGLNAAMATLTFTVNLAVYLQPRAPTHFNRLLSWYKRRSNVAMAARPSSTSALPALAAFLSDFRKTLRLTGLFSLYTRLRGILSSKVSRDGDPILRRVAIFQCGAYIAFQVIENIYHLQAKGILPASMVNRHGGMAKWIAWSCRAWAIAVAADFLRLWREAWNAKVDGRSNMTAEEEALRRKWWQEFAVAFLWFPVALHTSFYPNGIRYMNPGTVALLSFLATFNNLRGQWKARA